jgi:hypothetical protein
MVEVWLGLVVLGILSILSLIINFDFRKRLLDESESLNMKLDVMDQALSIVAEVLQQIPNLVPQFQIQNNPLSQILEFFQGMKAENTSYSDAQLRDDTGKFSDGEKKSEESTEEPQ